MLRASLFGTSALLLASVLPATGSLAGPGHSHQRAALAAVSPNPIGVRARSSLPIARPPVAVRPVFIGSSVPFFPYSRPVRTVFVDSSTSTQPRSVTVTVNTIPVVLGIRRPPEAAPEIYRIEDGRDGQRLRHGQNRQMAPSAGVHHVPEDTTTPRIIVVRGL